MSGGDARLGFVMLAHAEMKRAGQMARHLARRGFPVALHLDKKVSDEQARTLRSFLAEYDNVIFVDRYNCGWGLWSMVQATQAGVELLLKRFASVQHVALISGDCLPLRPVQDMADFLARHPQTDFIESVTVQDVPWTIGGLQAERFELRFPFSWRTQRRLFDGYVNLQRRLKMRRRVPRGIQPHLGSQWWCLTRATLEAILNDPRRAEFDRYFSKVWIPDESYFQTLVRRTSVSIESRSLMLSKFDTQGKPFNFYDDHLELLRNSDRYLVRKVWPQADKLYEALLSDMPFPKMSGPAQPHRIEKVFDEAIARGRNGRQGLFMQSRFPSDTWQSGKTAAPYYVFQGYDDVVEGFLPWLARWTGARVHGHLFSPDEVCFAERAQSFNGGLHASCNLRDANPQRFLSNLIWNARGETQCFQIAPYDRQDINEYMVWDANAHISVISGAWAIRLFRSGARFTDVRKQAAQLQKIENTFLEQLQTRGLPSTVRIITLAEFLEDPMLHLQDTLDLLMPMARRHLAEAPNIQDLRGFGDFLQKLTNAGMKPYLTGDIANDSELVASIEPPRDVVQGKAS